MGAAKWGEHVEIATDLLKNVADINLENEAGETVLKFAERRLGSKHPVVTLLKNFEAE